jgi:hypothetical protein
MVCFDNINKPKNQITKTKTKEKRNPKTKQQSQNKNGGERGGPVVAKLLCTVLVWFWLIACFFILLISHCV